VTAVELTRVDDHLGAVNPYSAGTFKQRFEDKQRRYIRIPVKVLLEILLASYSPGNA
jgi:hypothetical protein